MSRIAILCATFFVSVHSSIYLFFFVFKSQASFLERYMHYTLVTSDSSLHSSKYVLFCFKRCLCPFKYSCCKRNTCLPKPESAQPFHSRYSPCGHVCRQTNKKQLQHSPAVHNSWEGRISCQTLQPNLHTLSRHERLEALVGLGESCKPRLRLN